MTFKLQNKYLAGFVNWFGILGDLTAKQVRMRGRFLIVLVDRLNEVANSHKSLLVKYAKKDEKGEPLMVKVGDVENYDISDENMPEFTREDQELLNEFFVMDLTEANQEMFNVVKDLILNTGFTFGPKETDSNQERQQKIAVMNDYENWCKAFEEVK